MLFLVAELDQLIRYEGLHRAARMSHCEINQQRKKIMCQYHVAIGPFGRGPVRDNRIAAQDDAQAFGSKATVRGLSTTQAKSLIEQDRAMFGAIVALQDFNGSRLDARLARSQARLETRDAQRA